MILEAERLYRFYHAGDDETLALRGISLSVERGELVAVAGPSGSGKSTLLNCLAGLDEPDGGQVRIAAERLSRRPTPLPCLGSTSPRPPLSRCRRPGSPPR